MGVNYIKYDSRWAEVESHATVKNKFKCTESSSVQCKKNPQKIVIVPMLIFGCETQFYIAQDKGGGKAKEMSNLQNPVGIRRISKMMNDDVRICRMMKS